jgi:3-oxo-4,17-pregnadiene-20-carboxyl-CoA hydratase beta subunit
MTLPFLPRWDTLTAGDVLPEIALEVTEQTVILVPVSTWDLFPGHHSPSYARAQGQQDMYLNTVALQGVADRTITDALGPQTWVMRRRMQMVGSVYPGDTLSGVATVAAVRPSPVPASVEADFEVEMSTARGLVLKARTTACRYHREGR